MFYANWQNLVALPELATVAEKIETVINPIVKSVEAVFVAITAIVFYNTVFASKEPARLNFPPARLSLLRHRACNRYAHASSESIVKLSGTQLDRLSDLTYRFWL